jgi:hypothetical protein
MLELSSRRRRDALSRPGENVLARRGRTEQCSPSGTNLDPYASVVGVSSGHRDIPAVVGRSRS